MSELDVLYGMLDAAEFLLNRSKANPVLEDVLKERERQDQKWGEQNHDPFTYLSILIEEIGEFAQAALQARFGDGGVERMREEAVQMAAVALAIVQCLDRGKRRWPNGGE